MKIRTPSLITTLAALFDNPASIPSAALAQTQGVTKDEVVIGTIQDLSGPIAAFGKSARNGMQLRADEANEQEIGRASCRERV